MAQNVLERAVDHLASVKSVPDRRCDAKGVVCDVHEHLHIGLRVILDVDLERYALRAEASALFFEARDFPVEVRDEIGLALSGRLHPMRPGLRKLVGDIA